MFPRKFGDYSYIRLLGRGANGRVHKVRSDKDGKVYALKEVEVGLGVRLDRLDAEVASHRSLLEHENVVQFIDNFKTLRSFCIVMEFCDLGTLENYVINNQLDCSTISSFILGVTRGVRHLHDNNIIHRDVKPENVLLATGPNGKPICKISDFGTTTDSTVSHVLQTTEYFDSVCGTPAFLAPEAKKKIYTKACDIFSLGVLFYAVHCPERTPDNLNIKVGIHVTDNGVVKEGQFYNASDSQIREQVRKYVADDKMVDLICSMVQYDYKSRVSIADVEQMLTSGDQRSDGMFLAVCALIGVLLMFLLFPLPLFVLTVVILGLAYKELVQQTTIRNTT